MSALQQAVKPYWSPIGTARSRNWDLPVRIEVRLTSSHSEAARLLIGRVALLELAPPVLARALEPFPHPVRTLDAIHLASIEFLRERGHSVYLAAYDQRMLRAARRFGIPIYADVRPSR